MVAAVARSDGCSRILAAARGVKSSEDAQEPETERRVAGLVLLKVAGSVYPIGTQCLGPTSPFVSGGAALTANVPTDDRPLLHASAPPSGPVSPMASARRYRRPCSLTPCRGNGDFPRLPAYPDCPTRRNYRTSHSDTGGAVAHRRASGHVPTIRTSRCPRPQGSDDPAL
jgi:hypothetical protein